MGKVRELVGVKAARAGAREATGYQVEASQQAQERLAPFLEAGMQALPTLMEAIIDPGSRAQAVISNPLFQQLAAEQEQRLMGSQAARGKLGSGETNYLLNRNLLNLGQGFAQQDIANLMNITNMGQNAAAGVGNLLLNQGEAQAAGAVSRANLLGQSKADLLANFGTGGMMGAMTGGAVNPQQIMGLMQMAGGFCDERLKENKKLVGTCLDDGLPIYEFNYIGTSSKYRGKMAQDIMQIDPDAVSENDEGYLMVSARYAPELING